MFLFLSLILGAYQQGPESVQRFVVWRDSVGSEHPLALFRYTINVGDAKNELPSSCPIYLFLGISNIYSYIYIHLLLVLSWHVSPLFSVQWFWQPFPLFSGVCRPLTSCVLDGGWSRSSNIGQCGLVCSNLCHVTVVVMWQSSHSTIDKGNAMLLKCSVFQYTVQRR